MMRKKEGLSEEKLMDVRRRKGSGYGWIVHTFLGAPSGSRGNFRQLRRAQEELILTVPVRRYMPGFKEEIGHPGALLPATVGSLILIR